MAGAVRDVSVPRAEPGPGDQCLGPGPEVQGRLHGASPGGALYSGLGDNSPALAKSGRWSWQTFPTHHDLW